MGAPQRSNYDVVVIGGGHNGLTTAAYLAKAGKSVLVCESRDVLGGCCTTEELWPGYKVSTAAYVVSLLQPAIMRELKLAEHGLQILPRNPSSFTPLPDGRSLLLGPDAAANHREISAFSTKDAAAYPRYNAFLERVAGIVEPMLAEVAPDVLPLPARWRKIGLKKRLADLRKAWRLRNSLATLGADLPEAIELILGAARPILERWFESEALKATLATDAVIGSFTSINAPSSAYVLLHHVMGEAGGARGVWGYVRGGMGALSDAIAASAGQLGAEIATECPIEQIIYRDGRAAGVAAGGREVTASVVASSIDAHWTFRRLLPEGVLPAEFVAAIDRIDYSSASAKLNLALGEPPNFTARPSDGVAPHHHGTMHISPTMNYVERAYDDAKYGRPSDEPILEMTMPTAVDDSIAPPGKHVIGVFVQYAPYKLAAGSWDDVKESFADRCVEIIGRYAPNVPGAVEHRQFLSPLDLERTFGLTGGNIFQGAMNTWQLHMLRPTPGWADHRTPLTGLYLCGAASHPGGGVMGTCGRNAAQVILSDW